MRRLAVLILMVSVGLAGVGSQSVRSAAPGNPTVTESAYIGKVLLIAEMAYTNGDDLFLVFNAGVAGSRSQTQTWKTEIAAIVYVWDALLAQAGRTDPPTAFASLHNDLLAALDDFVEAGNNIEQGLDQGSNSSISTGFRMLEDALDDLTAAVSQVNAFLGGEEVVSGGQDSPAVAPQSGGSGASLQGVGTSVSDSFNLSAGRYKVSATLRVETFSGFIVSLYGPDGESPSIFNEIIQEPGSWSGSTIVNIPTTGTYYVEVDNTTEAWTLEFEPI